MPMALSSFLKGLVPGVTWPPAAAPARKLGCRPPAEPEIAFELLLAMPPSALPVAAPAVGAALAAAPPRLPMAPMAFCPTPLSAGAMLFMKSAKAPRPPSFAMSPPMRAATDAMRTMPSSQPGGVYDDAKRGTGVCVRSCPAWSMRASSSSLIISFIISACIFCLAAASWLFFPKSPPAETTSQAARAATRRRRSLLLEDGLGAVTLHQGGVRGVGHGRGVFFFTSKVSTLEARVRVTSCSC